VRVRYRTNALSEKQYRIKMILELGRTGDVFARPAQFVCAQFTCQT
jgi:hypothetical protein